MTVDKSPRKLPGILIELLVAFALLGVGSYGLLRAVQQRPYLGEPASSLLQVPQRVLAAPNVVALLLFLLSGFAVITALAWAVLRLIHQAFFRPVSLRRVWREAAFVAVFGVSLAWLQLNQAFSLLLAAAVGVALILLEIFLNIREREE